MSGLASAVSVTIVKTVFRHNFFVTIVTDTAEAKPDIESLSECGQKKYFSKK